MARPKTTELTERELELMHVFWEHGPLTAVDARQQLGILRTQTRVHDRCDADQNPGRQKVPQAIRRSTTIYLPTNSILRRCLQAACH